MYKLTANAHKERKNAKKKNEIPIVKFFLADVIREIVVDERKCLLLERKRIGRRTAAAL